MSQLSQSEKKALRGQGQVTPSILTVGKKGVTPNVLESLAISFRTQPLLKVTLDADREEREAFANTIAEHFGAEIISMVGKSCVLYKAAE